MTVQSVASIFRQILAIAGIVFSVLTQSVTALHLSASESAILGVAGALILAIEHYVADPSTGTTATGAPTPATPASPGAPVVAGVAVVPAPR
jgi:hypothetical protein